jgi:hypothetical protein
MTDFCLESRDTRLRGSLVIFYSLVKRLESKPIVFHNITLSQFPQKVFIMGDDDQLEIRVALTLIDDTAHIKVRLYPVKLSIRTHSTKLAASASMFSVSNAFVGSSRARIPQLWPKESERASRIMIDASIFCPAEQRPRISIST